MRLLYAILRWLDDASGASTWHPDGPHRRRRPTVAERGQMCTGPYPACRLGTCRH